MSNYVYLRSEPGLFTVGYYDPYDDWQPESDHPTPEAAAARVRWLNGGRDEKPLTPNPITTMTKITGTASLETTGANENLLVLCVGHETDDQEHGWFLSLKTGGSYLSLGPFDRSDITRALSDLHDAVKG